MCFLKNLSKSEISSGLTIDVTWNPSASRLLFVLVWRADALQLLRCWITPIVPASSFLGTSHRPYIPKRVIVPSDVFCFFLRIHAHRSCLWHSIYGPSIPEFMHVGTSPGEFSIRWVSYVLGDSQSVASVGEMVIRSRHVLAQAVYSQCILESMPFMWSILQHPRCSG